MLSPVNETDQSISEKRSRFKIKNVGDTAAAGDHDRATAAIGAAGSDLVDGTNSGNTTPQAAEVLLQVVNDQFSNGTMNNLEVSSGAAAATGVKKSRFTVKAVPPPAPNTAMNGASTNGAASSDPSAQLILSKLEQIIEMNSILMCKVLNSHNSNSNQSSNVGAQAPSSSSAENKSGSSGTVVSPSVSSSNVNRTGDIAAAASGLGGMTISSSSNGNGSSSNLANGDYSESKQATTTTADSSTGNTNTNSSTSSSSSSSSSIAEKEKIGLGRLTHHLNEMKKELELAQKQRKDTQLETQRLREKCQQLEDKLSVEQTKCAALDEKVSKLKEQSKAQRQLIEQLQLMAQNGGPT